MSGRGDGGSSSQKRVLDGNKSKPRKRQNVQQAEQAKKSCYSDSDDDFDKNPSRNINMFDDKMKLDPRKKNDTCRHVATISHLCCYISTLITSEEFPPGDRVWANLPLKYANMHVMLAAFVLGLTSAITSHLKHKDARLDASDENEEYLMTMDDLGMKYLPIDLGYAIRVHGYAKDSDMVSFSATVNDKAIVIRISSCSGYGEGDTYLRIEIFFKWDSEYNKKLTLKPPIYLFNGRCRDYLNFCGLKGKTMEEIVELVAACDIRGPKSVGKTVMNVSDVETFLMQVCRPSHAEDLRQNLQNLKEEYGRKNQDHENEIEEKQRVNAATASQAAKLEDTLRQFEKILASPPSGSRVPDKKSAVDDSQEVVLLDDSDAEHNSQEAGASSSSNSSCSKLVEQGNSNKKTKKKKKNSRK